jgi:hypothetical protein
VRLTARRSLRFVAFGFLKRIIVTEVKSFAAVHLHVCCCSVASLVAKWQSYLMRLTLIKRIPAVLFTFLDSISVECDTEDCLVLSLIRREFSARRCSGSSALAKGWNCTCPHFLIFSLLSVRSGARHAH